MVQIGLGRTDSTIPVYGRDELGRIARLLRHTLGQLNMQRRQLEQEVAERKEIEADLRAMQDELIQTAKLAVVGQTMTTLAHEINQPLNALSMYLFTAGRAIEQGQSGQARNTLTKRKGSLTGLTPSSVRCGSLPAGRSWKRHCIPLICAKLSWRHGSY